ncbi:hypothetical protein TNCV_2800851 [Trichonephila clavipes]|nr:hypothetical protein TNCV_2800851 [Trichonephila clavipes]
MEDIGRDDQTRQTRATTRGRNKQAEKPVRSSQATTRRPCPYYLRSRLRANDGIPEELRNIEINVIPHSKIRRRSLSMEALDGDPKRVNKPRRAGLGENMAYPNVCRRRAWDSSGVSAAL